MKVDTKKCMAWSSLYIPAALIARLISPEWDLNDSTVNDFFASYLTQIDFVVRHFENQ